MLKPKGSWSVQRRANRKRLDAKRYPLNARGACSVERIDCHAGGFLNSSTFGRSLRELRPKTSKNLLVVPYSIGLPKTSARPTIFTRPFYIKPRITSPTATPLMASMSARMTGCL